MGYALKTIGRFVIVYNLVILLVEEVVNLMHMLAVGGGGGGGLGVGYLEGYAAVCDCVAAVEGGGGGGGVVGREERETLASAGTWLASHARMAVDGLRRTTEGEGGGGMRTACARLRLVLAYVAAATAAKGVERVGAVPVVPRAGVLDAVEALVRSEGGGERLCVRRRRVVKNTISTQFS